MSTLADRSLALHAAVPPGKIGIRLTKPLASPDDLSLAYSPGVAAPVLRIADDPDMAYRYTNKGNFVAVISNGTAILGLGNRGALASKPVMEGKAALFRRFAGIDAIDIEIDATDPEAIIETVQRIAPTFGGINLEDIRAPECFEIERRLAETLTIPVFHDDQRGTAVVAGAALMNALEIAGKSLANVRIAMNGAGAAGIAVASMLILLGARPEYLTLCDSRGVLGDHRDDLHPSKRAFARSTTARTLADAVRGADVFIGVSVAGCLTPDMLRSMASRPIVLALANPDPEIDPDLARHTREDVLLATGRSDQPNQVNNILCFPFLFRAALDVRAIRISDAMTLAAVRALASLAHAPVPPEVMALHRRSDMAFGPRYLLPSPFDPRLLPTIARSVAQDAIANGDARVILDLSTYAPSLSS